MVKVVGYLTVVNVRKHLRYLLTTLTGPMGKFHRPVNRVTIRGKAPAFPLTETPTALQPTAFP